MRTFTPIIIHKGKGLYYTPLTIEKAVIFGEKHLKQKVIFETEHNGIIEQLTLDKLKSCL